MLIYLNVSKGNYKKCMNAQLLYIFLKWYSFALCGLKMLSTRLEMSISSIRQLREARIKTYFVDHMLLTVILSSSTSRLRLNANNSHNSFSMGARLCECTTCLQDVNCQICSVVPENYGCHEECLFLHQVNSAKLTEPNRLLE